MSLALRPNGGGRWAVLAGVFMLALPAALVAMSQGAGLIRLPYNLHVVDLRLPGLFKLHMLASGLSLLLIPLVIAMRREARWHKPLGRVAAVAVLAGALTSFPVAIMSDSAIMARVGFFAQGCVWLGLLAGAIHAIRQRRAGDHARMMLAMAAVASGAIWVRLTTSVAVASPLAFDTAYSAAAWLGWLLPLALVWRWQRPI